MNRWITRPPDLWFRSHHFTVLAVKNGPADRNEDRHSTGSSNPHLRANFFGSSFEAEIHTGLCSNSNTKGHKRSQKVAVGELLRDLAEAAHVVILNRGSQGFNRDSKKLTARLRPFRAFPFSPGGLSKLAPADPFYCLLHSNLWGSRVLVRCHPQRWKSPQIMHPSGSPRKNGPARYRVRTCGPYRVKVMLYH